MSNEVLIAFIAATPPTIAALRATHVSKKNNKELRGNGHGTHTQMLERVSLDVISLTSLFHAHVQEDRQVAEELHSVGRETNAKLDDVIETQNALVRKALK